MTRRGFTIIELLVVVAILGLLVAILLPCLARARQLSRDRVASSAGAAIAPPEPPTVEDMEEAAEKASKEHDIYDRIAALTESKAGGTLTVQIARQNWGTGLFDSSTPAEIKLYWTNDDLDLMQVELGGKLVYQQIDGDIEIYLGMGEWEHLLGYVEQKVVDDREERFRAERERRFGPLPGWGD